MTKRSAVLVLSVVATWLSVPAIYAESLGEIFNRVKTEFSQGDYKRSLADVDALDAASQQPAAASERPKLVGVIAFYRAANLAALGRADEAKAEFINFLMISPNASITSPPFPKPVLDAFQKAQKGAAGRTNGLAVKYSTFIVPSGWKLAPDTLWATSPVRYLLTADEKKAYTALATPADREAFVENFWKALDPTPDTPVNEMRMEFERRVAFADANFGSDKAPGRETDRGLVFTYLGPPTYAGAAQISADSDAIASLRSVGNSSGSGKTTPSSQGFGALSGASADDNLEMADKRGTRETWYYRKDRLPAGIPFQEVDFQFITKEGYGTGVMEKDSQPLQTLGQAAQNARKIKKLN